MIAIMCSVVVARKTESSIKLISNIQIHGTKKFCSACSVQYKSVTTGNNNTNFRTSSLMRTKEKYHALLVSKSTTTVSRLHARQQLHQNLHSQSNLTSSKIIKRRYHISTTTFTSSSFYRYNSSTYKQIANKHFNKQYYNRSFMCSVGSRLSDEMKLFFSLIFPTPIIDIQFPNNDNDDDESKIVFILSTSPMKEEEEDSSNTIVQRIIQWIQSFWKQCSNVALVTIRGSEIIIRMSPFLILTPASIFAAQFIYNSHSNSSSNNVAARVRGINDEEYAPLQRLNSRIRTPTKSQNQQNQQQQDKNRFRTIQTNNVIADVSWEYFLYSVTTLGPAFVKLCQWIATRRDIFAPNICNRLALLHDRGICHEWHHTHTALCEAFGVNYHTNGLHIDHDPTNKYNGVIGCGSAAQVYTGTLHTATTSIPVAIKVLHPRFHHLVERDLWFINSVADMLHTVPIDYIRMLNFPRVARNFGQILQLQSNLKYEAENLNKFRINFYGSGTEDESSIFFPKPIDNWISEQILVEQLVENAVPISEYLENNNSNSSIATSQEIRKELAIPLLNAFLKMVFWDNFVHCDLHPGNVLVRTYQPKPVEPSVFNLYNKLSSSTLGGKEEMKRQVVFLDAGISFQLEKEDQRNLIDLFRAVVTNNGYEAGKLMVERAKYERCSQVEGGVHAFSVGIGEIVSEFHDRRQAGLTLGAVRIGSLLTRVLDLCRYHGVEIDPAMASVIVSTLVLEGLGRALEPKLNLIDFALPFIMGGGKV